MSRLIEVKERQITRHELYNSDECFLTGTAAEIIPIVKIDGRIIGNGKPGTITKKMLQFFKVIVRKEGTKYTISKK